MCKGQILPKKGVPPLKNYSPSAYENKGKIWDIGSSPNGMVYFASDKGLLAYDGKAWTNFKGSVGITRSVLVINDSLIYSGSDLDFGVWKKSGLFTFTYHSLYPFKEEVQAKTEEFWNVCQINDMIIFVSSQNLYLYKDEQLTKIKAPILISSSFTFNNKLYICDKNTGLYYFDKLEFNEAIPFQEKIKTNVLGIYQQDNKEYLVSSNEGIFSVSDKHIAYVDNSLSSILKEAKVFSFEPIGESYLAFGTILKGIIITDLEGNIIHQINKIKGLLSNTILSMHFNKNGKLWLGLDYGISSLLIYNNFTYFYDYRGDFGTGFVAKRVNDMFYLGTNQGLYRCSWENLNDNEPFTHFKLIPNSEGQVWSLLLHDNQLFIGHDQGLFSLHNNKLSVIHYQDGIWNMIPYKDYILAGTYNGISIFKKSNGKWVFHKHMDSIFGSCNQLLFYKKYLWVNVPNFGFIQVTLNDSLVPVKQKIYSFDSLDGNNPYLIIVNDTLYSVTDQASYVYLSHNPGFYPSQQNMAPEQPENILSGIYLPVPLCDDYSFYPLYNGFALKYHNNDLTYKVQEKPLFRNITAFNNKDQIRIHNNSKIPFKLKNLHISYVLPNIDNALFQYRLKKESDWGAWTKKDMIDLYGLEPGNYHFELRSKTGNQITEATSFTFKVLKPWYKTWQAYLGYLVLLSLLILFFIFLQKRMLRKANAKLQLKKEKEFRELEEKHQAELLKLEQERIQNEYEHIKKQLRSKTIELATKSKESEDMNQFLVSLQEKIVEMQKAPQVTKSRLAEMNREINAFIKEDDNTFEIQMDELHQEFFRNIKKDFPDLSNNDLRLCVYIRVGLSSKEIANILNIQPSSSYISRSRLRKKLNLNTEDDLYTFLNKY